jgi:hypothetical protein
MPETKKKMGRPRLSDEEKKQRKIERMKAELEAATNPPPPNISESRKKGGDRGEPKNAEANKAIVSQALRGMKHDMVDTYNDEEILHRFMEYLNDCKENCIIPTMEGVYLWLGMSKQYFSHIVNRYENYTRPEPVVQAMQKIKDAMASVVSSAADVGSIAQATAIMKITNQFGYLDVKQVQHIDASTPKIGTEEDYNALQERYSAAQLIPDDIIETDYVELDKDGNEIPPTL